MQPRLVVLPPSHSFGQEVLLNELLMCGHLPRVYTGVVDVQRRIAASFTECALCGQRALVVTDSKSTTIQHVPLQGWEHCDSAIGVPWRHL